MTPAELLDRANKARAVLEAHVYMEAYDNCRTAILKRIEECPMQDTATAEDLRKCLKLLRDVRANLELAMSQGKLASFELEQEKKRRDIPLLGRFYR